MKIEQEEGYHLQEAHGSLLRLYIFFLLMFQSLFQLSDMVKFLSMFFLTLNKTFKSLPESLVSKLPSSVQDARVNWLKPEYFAAVCVLPILSQHI